MGIIAEDQNLRDRVRVFRNRHDAGRKLGTFLRGMSEIRDPVVCAIPAGGVPVGVELASAFNAPLELAVVRKIKIPWNPEAGFGGMSWDGQVILNERLLNGLMLSEEQVKKAIELTRKNVQERIKKFMGDRQVPDLKGRCVILTDDGIASGYTMLAAIMSIRRLNPERVIVSVPTASAASAAFIAGWVDTLVCLNIREDSWFAVAEAYGDWYDLDDHEVLAELENFR
jgi:predicted phosphoribosyltransferase